VVNSTIREIPHNAVLSSLFLFTPS